MTKFNNYIKQGFYYTEHNSIKGIEAIWDMILEDEHPLKSINLNVLESSQPENMQFRYLFIHENETLCGLIYLQQLKLDSNYFDGTLIDKPGLGWLKRCVNSHFEEVLICGNLFRIHLPGFFVTQKANESLVFETLAHYFNHSKDHSKFCGIIVKDCPYKMTETVNFKPYQDDVNMELAIDGNWKDFNDYHQSLSKKYRQRCQKIQKVKQELRVEALSLENIIKNANQLETLYLNVALKQSLRIGLLNANYFIEMKKRHGDDFIINAYWLNGTMVAFSSNILYPDNTMEIHFIGLDYKYNLSHCLYLNILFDGVEMAINQSSRKLELGRTARLAKASLGAKSSKIYNYLYLKKGVPSLAFSFFNQWFIKSLGNEWQIRNPLKSFENSIA